MRRCLVAFAIACAVPAAHAADPGALQRGEYLVERVGLCSDCHSPRDRTGQFVRSEWLRGASVDVVPKHSMPWAELAPPLAGLPPGYTRAELVTFLETGKRPDGSMARPPMPPYRFNRSDAQAVADYLRSLRPE